MGNFSYFDQNIVDLYQLRNLGKAGYEPAIYQKVYRTMTNTQKSIFWDKYNAKYKFWETITKIYLVKHTVNVNLKTR